jgi:signal peptidase I
MFPEIITELLQDGYKVSFRAPGHSMFPTIMANETIIVEPIEPATVKLGDIVLYRTNGRLIAHRVICIQQKINQTELLSHVSSKRSSNAHSHPQPSVLSPHHYYILRGDASATCDDPVTVEQILGKVVSVERDGCRVNPYSFSQRLAGAARRLSSRLKAILN